MGALMLATLAWSGGCATVAKPMVEPAFASRAYTPSRIALLPPDVFVVVDQVGDNDPARSAALGQAVTAQTVKAVSDLLGSRGYDVNLAARWDGIVGGDGALLVSRDELGWLANGILQFANSPDGGGQGPMVPPRFVAPELAARVGWATQSDALLYVNVKGVVTSDGKRAAQIVGAVFIVVIVAAIILAMAAQSKGGGGGSRPGTVAGGGWRGQPVPAASSVGGAGRFAGTPVPVTGFAPRGRGLAPGGPIGGGRVYGGGPHVHVGVMIPLNGPMYTHEGTVTHEDETLAGDDLYVAMTLVSAYDGRVLWHAREHLDLDADDPQDIQAMVQSMLGQLPPRAAAPPAPAAPTAPVTATPAAAAAR
jgi:hypothetical protein